MCKCSTKQNKLEIETITITDLSSGTTVDYARGVHRIKFSYTMELHKAGRSGFTPRPSRIVNVAKETLIGVLAMIKYVHHYYEWKKKRHVQFSNKVTYYVYY